MSPDPSAGGAGGEGSLVRRAQDGDTRAFEQLYRDHVGRICALCTRMTGDRPLAEDCTQETFVQAWGHLHGFKHGSSFATWLHRIAVNQVLMLRRRGQAQKRHLEVVGESWAVDEAASPSAPQPGSQMDLERAIGLLPPGARDVFVLRTVNGYSHEETAEMLGIAVGTSKAQLHRARKLLQERLSQ